MEASSFGNIIAKALEVMTLDFYLFGYPVQLWQFFVFDMLGVILLTAIFRIFDNQ